MAANERTRVIRIAALSLLALVATGCSGRGEPGENDIRAALKLAGHRGADKAVKLACKTVPERPGYVCDYRAPNCNRYTGTCGSMRPYTGRFVHADSRWQFVEDMTPKPQQDPVTQPLPGVTPAPGGMPGTIPSFPTTSGEPDGGMTVPPGYGPSVAPEPSPPVAPTPPPVAPRPPRPDPPIDTTVDEPTGRGEPLSMRDLGLVSRWITQNTRCRMGRPGERQTWQACEQRDRLARQLERRGLCYSPRVSWHRCR